VVTEKIETLIVGAGQAGIAMSEHLSNYKKAVAFWIA
jgi:cation diffusion facilitator CzcD-associated flavoprotein CzcO